MEGRKRGRGRAAKAGRGGRRGPHPLEGRSAHPLNAGHCVASPPPPPSSTCLFLFMFMCHLYSSLPPYTFYPSLPRSFPLRLLHSLIRPHNLTSKADMRRLRAVGRHLALEADLEEEDGINADGDGDRMMMVMRRTTAIM